MTGHRPRPTSNGMKKIVIVIVIVMVFVAGYYFVWPYFDVIERNDSLPEPVPPFVKKEIVDGVMEEMVMGEEGEPSALGPYTIVATPGHPASGIVRIFDTESGYVVRYEDYETINGPDLHVYLSKTLDAKEYIDLGPLKATKGNINYEVPLEVTDIGEYGYVLTWCKPFNVLFNYAEVK